MLEGFHLGGDFSQPASTAAIGLSKTRMVGCELEKQYMHTHHDFLLKGFTWNIGAVTWNEFWIRPFSRFCWSYLLSWICPVCPSVPYPWQKNSVAPLVHVRFHKCSLSKEQLLYAPLPSTSDYSCSQLCTVSILWSGTRHAPHLSAELHSLVKIYDPWGQGAVCTVRNLCIPLRKMLYNIITELNFTHLLWTDGIVDNVNLQRFC